MPPRSLPAVDDQTVAEIVGRHGNSNAVTGEHANVVPAHAARELRPDDGTALVHLDGVLATAEGVLDDTLHLQKIAFTHGFRDTKSEKARRT